MPDLTVTIAVGAQSKVLTVPEAKLQDFKDNFLLGKPAPDGVSDLDHFAQHILRAMKLPYIRGKRFAAHQAASPDENVMTED